MFVEGAPDDAGQLTHHGFCDIFGLKTDEYTVGACQDKLDAVDP
jgi:hypothetical protein